MALIAVILLVDGTLAFSLVTMSSAMDYFDSVSRRELRIQARLNARACLQVATQVTVADYFVSGEILFPEFGCIANFGNDLAGNIAIDIRASLGKVVIEGQRVIKVEAFEAWIISESVNNSKRADYFAKIYRALK